MERKERERQTLQGMIGLYCRAKHGGETLCESCMELQTYALQRLEKCPFMPDKPACAKCVIHCYRPAMRKRMKEVMRFAGPRMIWHYPRLAFLHFLDDLKR